MTTTTDVSVRRQGSAAGFATRGRLAAVLTPAGAAALAAPAAIEGVSPLLVGWLALFGAALGLAVAVDLAERRIPNQLTYPGTLLALAVAALAGVDAFLAAGAGALVAGFVTGVAWWVGRGALGMGDVKFSVLVGAVLGLAAVPSYLLFGTGIGALTALALLALGRGRGATFPYGPSLALGAVVTLWTSGFATAAG